MMQLWEGNSKGNFFSVSISKLRWVKIQFLAKKLLETWACIIQLYREPIGLSMSWLVLKSERSEHLVFVLFTNQKPSESGFWFERRNDEARERITQGVSQAGFAEFASSVSTKGQAIKSARGMPWHQEPMKDVISCDKLRGAANEHWSGDFRMGKPAERYPILNQIGMGGEPPELKHLSRARKRHQPRFRE